MLTVAEQTLADLAAKRDKEIAIHLYGQEVNPETFAITKADLLLKGEGEEADNMAFGSTLSADGFPTLEFDFMLSNPPYGKSWKMDLERMGGKSDLKDSRFTIEHAGDPEYSLVTRSSDGQLMFLVSMLSKMKRGTPLGSRIAEVHNGSSLFTGDAGQGESNIRRWIIENDWLEAIVALPLNMFYNTGIATYIWVLSNRKPEHRKGKVQLIDATAWFNPLRKNLGKKNCEFSDKDLERVTETFLSFKETEQSKIFANQAFGYWKVTVERPLRLRSQFTRQAVEGLRFASGNEQQRKEIYSSFGQKLIDDFAAIKPELEKQLATEPDGDEDDEEESETRKKALPEKVRKKLLDPTTWKRDHQLYEAAREIWKRVGNDVFADHNVFSEMVDSAAKAASIKLGSAERNVLLKAVSTKDEAAPPVRAKVHSASKTKPDPLRGLFPLEVGGKPVVVEYEPDADLRDTEQVPLLEEGSIEAFFRREVLPYTPDAWIKDDATKIGYEISFTRHFYKPKPLRSLEEIRADIKALEKETEGLLDEIVGGGR